MFPMLALEANLETSLTRHSSRILQGRNLTPRAIHFKIVNSVGALLWHWRIPMSRLSFPAFLFLASSTFFAAAGVCHQTTAQENVKITTADGVKLHAVFYASQKKSPPTVILLHPVGEGKSSKGAEWKALAEALQKADYSVMMFDFRGHGESTSIDEPQLFWNKAANVNYVRVKNKKDETIDVKDYIKAGGSYLPTLCNDIAAVRTYLDIRNDTFKDCNTSSLIVIGADAGATLGAIWMNSEWQRYKYSPPMGVSAILPKFVERNPEGKDIIAAVFLTPSPSLEKRTLSLSSVLKVAVKDNGTAATFFYGEEDTKASDFAKALESKLKVKDSKKHDYVGAVKLKTNLSGVKLLQKGLQTDLSIVKYLDNVVDDRKNDRVDRDFMTSYFVWRLNNGQFTLARNKKGEKNLNYDDFNKFIPQ
jgi:pimeloyl-ACP methyl ester carboxylesterase